LQSQVIGGVEDSNGDIFVEFMLAESGYLNENNIGFTPELLTKWHNEKSWEGRVHNAHPTKNHPLAYTPPPVDKSPLGQIAYYIGESAKWGFATYTKTKLRDIPNNQKRLNGITRITEEKAKQAWREGKFPKYSSSSVFIFERDANTGLITDAMPIASTSVDRPAFPVDIAGIYGTCVGGEECVTKLAESARQECNYCRHDVLTSFENTFSSNSKENISESSMGNDTLAPATSKLDPPTEDTGTPIKKISEEITSADGQKTEVIQEDIDWKAKYDAEVKAHKTTQKSHDDLKTNTDDRISKLEINEFRLKVRNIIDKVPLDIGFDNKEDNREKAVERYVKLFGKMSEKEILEEVQDKYSLIQKVAVQNNTKKTGLKESGISNDMPLRNTTDKADSRILNITKVFG